MTDTEMLDTHIPNMIKINDDTYDSLTLDTTNYTESVYFYNNNINNNINNNKLLTLEQELELGRRIKEGDIEALNILVESNLKLVMSIAKKYLNPSIPYIDLIQAGNYGLIVAANKYNPEFGNKFSTFAVYCIKDNIIRYIYNYSRIIRLPTHAFQLYKLIREAISVLSGTSHHICPTVTEITKYLNESNQFVGYKNITEEVVSRVIKFSDFDCVMSLNTNVTLDDEEELSIVDTLADNNMIPIQELAEKTELKLIFEQLFSALLTEKERRVLCLRFGIYDECPRTLHEIGVMFNLSGERIRQIEYSAIRKLRRSAKTKTELAGYF